jgi:hypothetical protein
MLSSTTSPGAIIAAQDYCTLRPKPSNAHQWHRDTPSPVEEVGNPNGGRQQIGWARLSMVSRGRGKNIEERRYHLTCQCHTGWVSLYDK